jgi:hypothetical protein
VIGLRHGLAKTFALIFSFYNSFMHAIIGRMNIAMMSASSESN